MTASLYERSTEVAGGAVEAPDILQQEAAAQRLLAIRNHCRVPGISVAVSQGGRRASAHVGLADLGESTPLSDRSRFEVSCLMKLFVSLLAQKMMHRGVVELRYPIGNYLSELSESRAGQQITFGDLLSHTSGYRGLDLNDARVKWGYSWPRLIEQLCNADLLFPPGHVFSYEHSEHVLIGEILSRTTGRTIDQLLNDEILDPLGIAVSCARRDQQEGTFVGQHVLAAGAAEFVPAKQPPLGEFWRSSLPDMTIRLSDVLRVGEWMLDDGNEQIRSTVDRQVVNLPRQASSSRQAEMIPVSFGHLCGRYEDGMYGHNGSVLGQTLALRMDMAKRAVYVVGINAWVPHARDRAVRLARDGKDPVEEDVKTTGDGAGGSIGELCGSFSFQDLTGTYDGGFARQVTVERDGDDAISMLVGAPTSRRRRITVTRRPGGLCEFGKNQDVSCAFTPHPLDGSPVLHIGVHAYRRRL